MKHEICGLSLSRPWPWAFVNGAYPKNIENRSWKTNYRGFIALHAAKSWDEQGKGYIEGVNGYLIPDKKEHPDSQIFAVGRLVNVFEFSNDMALQMAKPEALWAFGPYCWEITDIVALKNPVRCKGAQGLWTLLPDVLDQVRAAYMEAKHG